MCRDLAAGQRGHLPAGVGATTLLADAGASEGPRRARAIAVAAARNRSA
jgi:hypothetical protein